MLKTNAHRGQGVSVVPQQQAITAALASSTGEDAAAELVQEYKSAQYMVAGRRFYLRYPQVTMLHHSLQQSGCISCCTDK